MGTVGTQGSLESEGTPRGGDTKLLVNFRLAGPFSGVVVSPPRGHGSSVAFFHLGLMGRVPAGCGECFELACETSEGSPAAGRQGSPPIFSSSFTLPSCQVAGVRTNRYTESQRRYQGTVLPTGSSTFITARISASVHSACAPRNCAARSVDCMPDEPVLFEVPNPRVLLVTPGE